MIKISFKNKKLEFDYIVNLVWVLNIGLDEMEDKMMFRSKRYKQIKSLCNDFENKMIILKKELENGRS